MRFGLFGGAEAPRTADGDPGRGFREFIETSVEAERLGFHSTFLVEHHFSGSGQVSAPLDLLSWVAARTTSIRVGTAVLVPVLALPEIVVEPPAAQKPHPPVWIAAGRPESVRKVAALGANLLLDQFASTEAIGERIALFKAECEARDRAFDPMDVAVARNLYVARDAGDASAALDQQAGVHTRMIERYARPRRVHALTDHGLRRPGRRDESAALFGPPEEMVAGLKALQAVGVRYVLISGGDATQSMQRFAAAVMPAFQEPGTSLDS